MKDKIIYFVVFLIGLFSSMGLLSGVVYAQTQNCDTSILINEYSEGSTKNSETIYFNDNPYEIVHYSNDRYLLIDKINCKLVSDNQITQNLIKSYLYLQGSNRDSILETYRIIRDCHGIAWSAKLICSTTSGIDEFLESAPAKVIESSGKTIPNVLSKVAPYGWKIETKQVAKSTVKTIMFMKKTNEIQITLDVVKYSSCALSNSVVTKIYDYSNLAYNINNEMNSDRFYSNSVEVVYDVNNDILNYLNTDSKKSDFLKDLNGFIGGILNNDCSNLDNKSSKIYSNVLLASAFYKSVIESSSGITANYNSYIVSKKNDAFNSLHVLKSISTENNNVFKEAMSDFNNELYISAKAKADKEITLLSNDRSPPLRTTNNNWQTIVVIIFVVLFFLWILKKEFFD